MTVTALALVLVIALEPQEPPPSSAPPHQGYVQGTVMLTSQPAGTANHRVSPPLGGRATGIAAGAGIVLTPTVSLEGEVVLGGTISTPQRFSYFSSEDYVADHRDLLLNANLRSRIGPGPVELVIGAGLAIARGRQLSRVATRHTGTSTVIEAIPDSTEVNHVLNVGGGIDVPIPLNSRVAIVPTFRYRFLPRRSEGTSDYMGVGRHVYGFGASVRSRIDSRRPTSAAPRHAYVQGSAFATVQPAGRAADRVWPALGGRAAGIAVSGGQFITPEVAIEGEFALGRTVSLPQRFSYPWIEDYVADSRQHLLTGSVRLKPAGTSPVEVVVGGGLATSRIRKRSVVATAYPGSLNTPPPVTPDQTEAGQLPYFSAGLDAPVAVNAQVAVVPTFRLRWVRHRESGLATDLGVGRYSFQFGVSLRAGF